MNALKGNKKIGKKVLEAINVLKDIEGINLELCGSWLWVSGDTKPHKDLIKSVGGKWALKKKMWYVKPNNFWYHTKEETMENIRHAHGSVILKKKDDDEKSA